MPIIVMNLLFRAILHFTMLAVLFTANALGLKAQPFKNLSKYEAVYATYQNEKGKTVTEAGYIYYLPKLGKPISAKELNQLYPFTQNNLPETWLGMVRTRLSETDKTEYLVVFDWGMSDDYNFTFFRMEKDTLIPIQQTQPDGQLYESYIFGKQIYLPGNGFMYTAGHVNNSFNQRGKWFIQNNLLYQTPQPFYYVGLETKALKPLTLYADLAMTQKVADIAAGNALTVLLQLPPQQAPPASQAGDDYNPYEYFLLKTEFGLTGWVKIVTYLPDSPIEGLFFAGD